MKQNSRCLKRKMHNGSGFASPYTARKDCERFLNLNREEEIMKQDTIAAISSGLTQAGIGIIRISGPDSVALADRLFKMKKGTLSGQKSHTIHYGYFCGPEGKIDEVMAVLMRGPHSFTAEDVVEIQCHGGSLIMKKILAAILEAGARLAEPGEFTKRAFLNGRLDLSQAEAVMDLIQAQNDLAVKSSLEQLQGSVSEKVRDLRSRILQEMARIEASLDDPEHLSLDGYKEEFAKILKELLTDLRKLIDSAEEGRITAEGIRTVILGKPNAGKSSLLNQLLGEERAIVTDVAGTTRDTLEESIRLGGFSLRLIDTAGIRKTDDKVEKIGIDRARKQAEQADLILYVADSSEHLDENDRDIISLLKGRKALVLMNKIDLEGAFDEGFLEEITGLPVIPLSAKDGTGLDLLKKAIEDLFDIGKWASEGGVLITNLRHKQALIDAEKSLKLVEESLSMDMPEDFYTIDLMAAYTSLGTILGEEVGDDLVNEIFSRFCMGK